MKKVLILGAKGMLGRELIKVFGTGKKYAAIRWDKEEINVTDKNQVWKKIINLRPDIIINAAAYNAVDKCEKSAPEFNLAKKVNGEAIEYLANVAQYLNIPVVHFSTDYVFSGKNRAGYKEGARPSPLNRYAVTKVLGEKNLKKFTQKYYLIRTSKLFGLPGNSPEAKKSFFQIMLDLAKTQREIKAVDEELSCFTYVFDLAKKTREIIERRLPFGVYHITNSEPVTWYCAAQELFRQAGLAKKIKLSPVSAKKLARPARRPKYSVLLNTKLKPLRSYKLALKDFLRQMKI